MAVTENTFTGNGSTTNYSFTFPYLKESDVKVTVAGTAKTNGTGSDQWQFANATTVQFNTAPANSAAIRLYRETADTNLSATFYAGSAIKSQDLNDNFTQNLYVTQEVRDDSALALSNSREHDGDGTYTTAIAKSTSAVSTANTASTNASAAVSTANTASSNATTAVNTANSATTTANTASSNATTALNNSRESDGSGGYNSAIDIANTAKTTANSATTTANTASTNASSAVTTANTASTNASSAVTTANTASTNASNAVTTANTASTNASNAVSTANTASTNATTAVNTANSATTTANSAVTTANAATTTANTALSNSRESDGSGGYNTAISIANTAKSTADTSAATVANSAIYQVVNNYAALPSLNSVDNAKFYQVTDTTNIENNFSDITGEPSNFVGHSGLTVKLKSNTTASPKVWEWQEYYANDPETRYRKKIIVENLNTIDEDYTITANNNAFSVGPVVVAANKTVTINANSLYFIG